MPSASFATRQVEGACISLLTIALTKHISKESKLENKSTHSTGTFCKAGKIPSLRPSPLQKASASVTLYTTQFTLCSNIAIAIVQKQVLLE